MTRHATMARMTTIATSAVQDALDFALALEIFESEFYGAVLGTSASAAQNDAFATVRAAAGAVAGVVPTLQQIQRHEAAHVATLLAAGARNVYGLDAASFDFTGGGTFARATSTLPFLLELAQGLEDTGVRAYKGQATILMASPAVLETAMRIHSVEARHASRLRRLRRLVAGAGVTVRLSGTVRGGGEPAAGLTDRGASDVQAAVTAAFERIYGAGADATTAPSEATVVESGINVTTLEGATLGTEAAQEAFDQPLDRADVVAIVQPFFRRAIA